MGGMFSKPKIPPPPPVIPMGDPAKVDEARRRSLAAQRQRGGRESTLLSGGDKLGG